MSKFVLKKDNVGSTSSLLDEIISALKNPSIELNKFEIDFIIKVTKNNPEIFETIQNSIEQIVKDGHIDLNDVPEFVILVTNLLNINTNNFEINIPTIIKFIINVVFTCGLIPLNKRELDLIIKLVEVCLKLLETTILTPEIRNSCYDRMKKFFSNCCKCNCDCCSKK